MLKFINQLYLFYNKFFGMGRSYIYIRESELV